MAADAGTFFGWLRGYGATPQVLMAVAHPDDETVGAGAVLARLPDVRLVCATDGAPHDRALWGDPSPATREDYAALRRRELRCALAVARHGWQSVEQWDIPDQDASSDLADLALRMRDVLQSDVPEVVLAPAYEGGHPDHDAVAFAVHAARAMLARDGDEYPAIVEFALCHGRSGSIVAGTFASGDEGVVTLTLSAREVAIKDRMVACHASQRATLALFPLEGERFRVSPSYDFTRPPRPGKLNYELWGWMTGDEWRSRAAAAMAELGLETLDVARYRASTPASPSTRPNAVSLPRIYSPPPGLDVPPVDAPAPPGGEAAA
jgi:LmbE family N-acetylglucosaminyl deacetylase